MSEPRIPPRVRGVRLGAVPSISVVVASDGPRQRLEAFLGAVRDACAALEAEVVVARAADGAELESLRAAHPAVRFVGAAEREPIEGLRAVGMDAAGGDVVRILEDRRPLPPGWAAPLAAARSPGRRGGAETAPAAHALDWQSYFDEQPQPGRID